MDRKFPFCTKSPFYQFFFKTKVKTSVPELTCLGLQKTNKLSRHLKAKTLQHFKVELVLKIDVTCHGLFGPNRVLPYWYFLFM